VKYVEEESRSSQRAPDIVPRVRPARARKDRRRWCRGKVGIKHQTTISIWKIYLARGITDCYQYQPGKKWTRWICVEQESCTQCGKILRHTLGPECTKRAVDR
jgi:hypothetical protein